MHHLLISGLLLELDSKKEFSRVFTKCYGHIMKDFVQDDHEHAFSITSLSVQLFTVPTIAHYLIRKEDVLAILLRTFMSDFKYDKQQIIVIGRLSYFNRFPRRSYRTAERQKLNVQRAFSDRFRSFFILYDLKHLLTIPPASSEDNEESWDVDLRKGFLHGFCNLVEILTWMQGRHYVCIIWER